MGLCFSKFWGISRRYGSPHKLAQNEDTKYWNYAPMATPTQRYTDAWASLVPLWLNLTTFGVSKDSVSPPSSEYTPLLSVVLYGSETWTVRKVDSDRIQSFHVQALRRILGIRWYDKVSNAEVNERTKLSYCWQTSFIIWSHLSPTGEHTCFAGTASCNCQ